jgi:hypothetical protein
MSRPQGLSRLGGAWDQQGNESGRTRTVLIGRAPRVVRRVWSVADMEGQTPESHVRDVLAAIEGGSGVH